jgi:hypothetical protein
MYDTIPPMPRLIFTLCLLLFACAPAPAIPTNALPSPAATIIRLSATPHVTETPTITPISTPLPHLMYPYTIAGLRERVFTGGEISLDVRIAFNDEFSTWLISYPSDGLRITGVLNIPAGEGPFPVIVMNHGYYPRSQYSSGDGSQRAAEFLTRRGYLTISSDYRSWGGSDVAASFFHTGLVADVMNLIASLASLPHRHVGPQYGRRHHDEDSRYPRWSSSRER